ncbi:lipoyltransferase 1, mitochondrial [Dunckerocampus dactyliophorus]|uniref:lipoyltransferase 1, mitochondrial n=1 Tax=Dunckerocampus dactyliophorus TaxID=161453 RepID=UPI00240509CC|nr:lipoyltransferase 1, mitochondrial [Dunckerocampus dactyliophorus]
MLSNIGRSLSLFRGSSGSLTLTQVTRACSSLLTDSSRGLVLYSQSTDIYENLSLEDWIEANVDLQQRNILLLWRNRPAVVIGRHQNPWKECNLSLMRHSVITLARRRSGGGTVFHDLGNLNMTFFASKKAYDRQRNLKVITEALKRLRPGLEVEATKRFDIFLKGRYKISGSASRISRKSSYHHCTLLHSADHSALSTVFRSSCQGLHSNATPSVPSPVANLMDYDPTLQWKELLDGLADQYSAEFGVNSAKNLVNPADDSAFPGLGRAAAELRGWDWVFGKTPKFSVQTLLKMTDNCSSVDHSAQLCLEVKSGVIENCHLDVPIGWLPQSLSSKLSGVLEGERFCPQRIAASFAVLLRCESGELQNRLQRLCDAILAVMG